MHHYTVGWDDSKHIHHEICEYAEDSWHAAQYAKEDVPYLKGHPFSINEILNAVSEINEVKVNTQIKSKKRVDNDDIPKNTLKLIEQAEKSKG